MDVLNSTQSVNFGQVNGVKEYHDIVRRYPRVMDKTVEAIVTYALNESMMKAGLTAQQIDREAALSAILETIDEQTISGLGGNETGSGDEK